MENTQAGAPAAFQIKAQLGNLAAGAAAWAAVGTAVQLQLTYDWQPCPWCIMQRYAYLLLGAIFMLRALLPDFLRIFFQFRQQAPENGPLAMALRVATTLVALIGAGMASFQLMVLASAKVSCGRDTLAAILNHLPPAVAWPTLFEATGSCADPYPVNFPLLALAGFILLGGFSVWRQIRR